MKQHFEKQYNQFIEILQNAINNIDNINGENTDFIKIKLVLKDALLKLLHDSCRESYNTLHNTVWDRLVIAFFGVTNAGKSTIIETFRILFKENLRMQQIKTLGKGVDGLIVGDGRQDFTKTYSEYDLTINDMPFTLIDVPGIEGNESEFKDEIAKALGKAHCVFYVHGNNQAPDEKTIDKIKKYLADWVNVYSIYNVKGTVGNYDQPEDRENLYNEKQQKTEQIIVASFRKSLGSLYCGNISIQGILALCSKATFSPVREDLLHNQEKCFKYFGNAEAAYDFSQFYRLVELVDSRSRNFKSLIYEANQQKFITLSKRVLNELTCKIKEQQEYTDDFKNLVISLKNELKSIVANGKSSIKSRIFSSNRYYCNLLEQKLCELIDSDCGTTKMKEKSSELEKEIQEELTDAICRLVKEELSKMETRFIEKKKSLDVQRQNYYQSFASSKIKFSQDINVKIALDEMNIKLGEVGSFILDVISGAGIGAGVGGGFGAGIGAIIGGLSYILRKVFFGDGGKGAAKVKIREEIRKARQSNEIQLTKCIAQIDSLIDKRYGNIFVMLSNERKNLNSLKELLNQVQLNIIETIHNTQNSQYGKK